MSFLFFFFKQKTAYEMRISYWSSDVCSSDLVAEMVPGQHQRWHVVCAQRRIPSAALPRNTALDTHLRRRRVHRRRTGRRMAGRDPRPVAQGGAGVTAGGPTAARSEEHTSELQSLMRTSYAVFCLKKKKKQTKTTTTVKKKQIIRYKKKKINVKTDHIKTQTNCIHIHSST